MFLDMPTWLAWLSGKLLHAREYILRKEDILKKVCKKAMQAMLNIFSSFMLSMFMRIMALCMACMALKET